MKDLKCDMAFGCSEEVTHIGSKGYAYCAAHAVLRRSAGVESTRRMRSWELQLLRDGQQLPSYAPGLKPTEVTR